MPSKTCNVVVLLSGSGSNLQALIDSCQGQDSPVRIRAVVSNRADAYGLQRAAAAGIDSVVLEHTQFDGREAFDTALMARIDAFAPDLVVLAGFMRILSGDFVRHYQGRLLNIHPSLLPAFTGLHTHERAIAMGCKIAGVTVHFVTAELDHGAIVVQAAVPVLPGDDAQALAARVLTAEHRIYPQAVRWFAEDALLWDGEVVRHRDGAAQQLLLG